MSHKQIVKTLVVGVFLIIVACVSDGLSIHATTKNIESASTTETNGVTGVQPVPTPPADSVQVNDVPTPTPAASNSPSASPAPQAAPLQNVSAPTHPVNLSIPAARVDAHVMNIGVTSSGNLDVPPNYTDVGWYQNGTLPGQKGSAVLDGHVDNAASIDGVFKHLRDLKNGDDIYVTMDNGMQYHYIVKASSVYPTSEFPGDMVFNQNDDAYLKIITCHGTYIPSQRTYDQRLIVTAVLM